jgi:hypothetical protein
MSDNFDDIFEQELINDIIKPSRKTNLEECDFFSELCSKKIDNSDSIEEINDHEKFKKLVDKLNCKYPFLKIHEFIEEFVDGLYNKHMIEKYNFIRKSDFGTIIGKANLNMVQSRQKELRGSKGYARRRNLMEQRTLESYNFSRKESDYFKEELEYMFNYTCASAIIILNYLIGNQDINKIIQNKEIIDKNNVEYYQVNMTNEISKIIQEDFETIRNDLFIKKILIQSFDEYQLNTNFEDIENKIKTIVSDERKGIIYSKIILKLIEEYPLIQFIPHQDIINKILIRFEKEKGIFKSEAARYNLDPTERRFFTISNYENQTLDTDVDGIPQFFGRENDPHTFIQDIQYLKKGGFDDEDDQVTRIAGLILSGTQKMISEPEKFSEFDFAVSMAGFAPTEEQVKVIEISKIVIRPDCNIVHLKIMLDEDVNVNTIESIRKILPENEQAMIMCFNKISEEVRNLILNDSSIQIIDKNSLHLWAQITPQIPSRKNSIVKIMAGNNLGKIARINNINYETGKASIQIIPSEDEEIVYIGFLKEINLFEDELLNEHLLLCENYFKFLNIVRENSNAEQFDTAIFNADQIIEKTEVDKDRWDLKENVTFSAKHESYISIINPSQNIFENIFHCSCNHFQTQNTLCFHLIAILNNIGITMNSFNETWNNQSNIFSSCISKI